MHIPNPLGGYPLVLRDFDQINPKSGELLYDYSKNDLYFITKKTKERRLVAEDIYKKIIASRLENSFINITKTDGSGDEPDLPDIKDRKNNHWYFNITNRNAN